MNPKEQEQALLHVRKLIANAPALRDIQRAEITVEGIVLITESPGCQPVRMLMPNTQLDGERPQDES